MIKIRKADMNDCANLAKVQVNNYRLNYAGFLPQSYLQQFSYVEQEQDWKDWIITHPDDVLVIAETENEEMVGYALGKTGPTSISPYDCELTAIHVSPNWQKSGIGRQLVREVAYEFIQTGCTSMMLWVIDKNPACLFYEHLGGQIVGKQTIKPGLEDLHFIEIAYGWVDLKSLISMPT